MATVNIEKTKRIAVYAGTFDPLTLGHEDIVERAARVFDKLILAVAHAHHKQTTLALHEREALVRAAFAGYATVQTATFSGLLRDFVRTTQACVMIRGVRNMQDMAYELQLAELNRHLIPEVETFFLASTPAYQCIGSTYVREIAKLGGEITAFVNPQVEKALQARLRTTNAKN